MQCQHYLVETSMVMNRKQKLNAYKSIRKEYTKIMSARVDKYADVKSYKKDELIKEDRKARRERHTW